MINIHVIILNFPFFLFCSTILLTFSITLSYYVFLFLFISIFFSLALFFYLHWAAVQLYASSKREENDKNHCIKYTQNSTTRTKVKNWEDKRRREENGMTISIIMLLLYYPQFLYNRFFFFFNTKNERR